jgi:uncharacterized protein (DUF2384 family)
MQNLQIKSVSPPFNEPQVARLSVSALGLADAMGLVPPEQEIGALDDNAMLSVLAALDESGVGKAWAARYAAVKDKPKSLVGFLKNLQQALEGSPLPEREWHKLLGVLGVDALTRLLGISPASLNRYQSGERATPDEVAERLHFLALVVGELLGSYNALGIRRWFERPRTALEGRSPIQILAGDWRASDPGARAVRDLARSLSGAGAT